MNRKLVTVWSSILLIAACGFAALRVKAQSGTASTAPAPKKAEEAFKNIQVLKGIPAEQLFPTMQFISASLGVECEFCHVHDAFEKDDKKPKQTARKMMAMMFAINSDNFDGHRQVTCNSCHRGSKSPVAIPAVMSEEPKQAAGAPHSPNAEKKAPESAGNAAPSSDPTSHPTADQLLDKYVQALGGASAVDKITSRVMKGTIDFGGRSLPIDIYAKDPEKRISVTHMPDGESVTAFNGREGWLGMTGRPVREMHGSELDAAAIDADLHLATDLKRMLTQLEVQGREKIGDHDARVIVGQRDGKTPIRLYFDEQTGLLVRLVRYGDTALGWLPTQIDYADYREANGVKVPYRWTLARPSGRFTIQVSKMQQNVPVDDANFVKPESPPEQPKGSAN